MPGLATVLKGGSAKLQYRRQRERTNLEMVQTICGLMDELRPDSPHRPTAKLIEFVPDRPGHDRRYAIDASNICRRFGWQPKFDLATGLRVTVEWYLANATWVERVTSGVYRRQRLGLPPGAKGAG